MSGLEQKFPGQVTARNVSAATDEAKAACEELGFTNHGLVIRSADGDALFSQPDHSVNMEAVEAALRKSLGASSS